MRRARELLIEFVLHGDGPAATWAAQAAPGQVLGVGGPQRSRAWPLVCDTMLLVGDETALPSIGRQLEELPPGVGALVLVEVADAGEKRHPPTAAHASVTWLARDRVPAGRSRLVDQALRDLTLPAGAVQAWIAAEIETARRLRRLPREEEGVASEPIRAAGYGRLGEAGAHARLDDEP